MDRAFGEERSAVVATVIRYVGDFSSPRTPSRMRSWTQPRIGVVAGCRRTRGAWLTVAARRRAIDRIRRSRALADRAAWLAALVALVALDAQEEDPLMSDEPTIVDDRLRLIFTCCQPALDMPARLALTLRALRGLSTGEIARAFLVAEPTMGKRIVRAKRKIADAKIPYRVPPDEEPPERIGGVLRVVYLVFNERVGVDRGVHRLGAPRRASDDPARPVPHVPAAADRTAPHAAAGRNPLAPRGRCRRCSSRRSPGRSPTATATDAA
ncbi:MAG: hypothetical protein M3071_09335 [Actinomycetota bacterium]|nr:hypothetical protein [Actinomycetota bacterium]